MLHSDEEDVPSLLMPGAYEGSEAHSIESGLVLDTSLLFAAKWMQDDL